MGQNRDRVLEQCNPAMELGFSLAEYKSRLQVIRRHMAASNIDLPAVATSGLQPFKGKKPV